MTSRATDFDDFDVILQDALGGEPPRDVDERLRGRLRAFREGLAGGGTAPPRRRRSALRWLIPIPAAAVVLLAVLLLIRPTGPTFAEVIQNFRSAETVTFKMSSSGKPEGQGPGTTSTFMFMEPGLMRVESPGGLIQVTSLQKGQTLVLNSATRTAYLVHLGGRAPSDNTGVSLVQTLRHLAGANAERLGRRKVDGHEAVGFRTKAGGGAAGSKPALAAQITVWADVHSGLPVRTEMQMPTELGAGTAVLSDFVYGEPLAPSLFNLQVPTGYKLQQFTMPAAAGPPTEKDLLSALREFADMAGGSFPPVMEPTDSPAETGAQAGRSFALLAKHLEGSTGGQPSQEQMQEVLQMARDLAKAMQFINALPAESDWHYSSKGVRLGDADKALCWWRPAGSETYTVVYGDLSTRQSTRPPRPAP